MQLNYKSILIICLLCLFPLLATAQQTYNMGGTVYKKDKIKYVATIIMGLGMIFFGLQLMTDGFGPIREIPEFVSWFQIFSATTYFGVLKCILLGAFLTIVVQSSSATLGITSAQSATPSAS